MCQDDKHTVKVGEPGMPVAAVERGKSVLVAKDLTYQVADHDFCKLSLSPPPSHCNRISRSRSMELLAEFNSHSNKDKPIECHYHDGGPDHNIRHMRNKLSNIAYFLNRDLDLLCSIQTPPQNSWKNPVERIMSIVNIGLYGVGSMRTEYPTCEGILSSASNMKEIRKLAKIHPEVEKEVKESVTSAKQLLETVFRELKLLTPCLMTNY